MKLIVVSLVVLVYAALPAAVGQPTPDAEVVFLAVDRE